MNNITLKRMNINSNLKTAEKTLKSAQEMVNKLKGQLHYLQVVECKHENATSDSTWQGGGVYYDKANCPDCGRRWNRYNAEKTRSETRNDEEFRRIDEREKSRIFPV